MTEMSIRLFLHLSKEFYDCCGLFLLTFFLLTTCQLRILSLSINAFCVFGASGIYLDKLVNKWFGYEVLDLANSDNALVTGLATSSGILLYSSWASVMQESFHFLEKISMFDTFLVRVFQFCAFFFGGIVFYIFNHFLHKWLHESSQTGFLHDHFSVSDPSPSTAQNHRSPPASCKRLSSCESSGSPSSRVVGSLQGSYCPSGTHLHEGSLLLEDSSARHSSDSVHEYLVKKPSNCDCECHAHFSSFPTHSGTPDDIEHIHSVYTMDIQTALLICLHKVPEGFITFLASTVDTGFMVLVAMSIHNIVEGFTIAYPLYLAWKSRPKAFLTAATLSSCSLPLGSLIAFLVMEAGGIGSSDFLNFLYGIIFAGTAGMMLILSLRVILPEALRHDHSENKRHSFICFTIGILFTLFLEIFDSH